MILTLQIGKEVPGLYRAEVLVHGGEVTPASHHSSIADAIRSVAGDVPEGFADFVEVRYGGFSSGTLTLEDAASRAAEVADRLVALVAMMHELAGR